MKYFSFLFILVFFVGCTSQQVLQTAPIPSPTPAGVSLPDPTPTSAPPTSTGEENTKQTTTSVAEEPISSPIPGDSHAPAAVESEVQIEAGDGLLISGTFHPGTGAPPWPGVLLMHMLSGDRRQWDELIPPLTENGYAVLAIDLRGHGATGGQRDWDKACEDALIAWHYLAELDSVDGAKTVLGGASIGANLALVAASNGHEIKTVVLLSPGLDYRGVTTVEALETYGDRPSFLAASSEDQYAAESSKTLADAALGEVELHIFEGAGHGTAMLSREPGLAGTILDWLERIVK